MNICEQTLSVIEKHRSGAPYDEKDGDAALDHLMRCIPCNEKLPGETSGKFVYDVVISKT